MDQQLLQGRMLNDGEVNYLVEQKEMFAISWRTEFIWEQIHDGHGPPLVNMADVL